MKKCFSYVATDATDPQLPCCFFTTFFFTKRWYTSRKPNPICSEKLSWSICKVFSRRGLVPNTH